MKKTFFYILFFSFSFSFATLVSFPAFAQSGLCKRAWKEPNVKMHIDYGDVEYIHDLRANKFKQYLKREMDLNSKLSRQVRGLTVASTKISFASSGKVQRRRDGFCVELGDVDIHFGYDKLTVLIEKKYPKNTCEYNVIKDHEDTHVFLNREVLRDYSVKIYNKAYEIVKNLAPVQVRRESQVKGTLDDMMNKLNEGLKPIINDFERARDKKNSAIDTDESYRNITAQCRNW